MRRPAAALLVAVAASLLAGCTGAASPQTPAVFDRPQTPDDALPAGIRGYDADTVRFVGEDSRGARYWVARLSDDAPCIIREPAVGDWSGACGTRGLSGTADDGTVVELASDPRTLSPETSELVGDAILVGHP